MLGPVWSHSLRKVDLDSVKVQLAAGNPYAVRHLVKGAGETDRNLHWLWLGWDVTNGRYHDTPFEYVCNEADKLKAKDLRDHLACLDGLSPGMLIAVEARPRKSAEVCVR